MIAIIDYDAGNLKSVEKALQFIGEECRVTRNREEILSADQVILPGVGSFGDAMEHLKQYGLDHVIREVVDRKIPLLGICLGLQLLFEKSEESPGVDGLGILKGEIYFVHSYYLRAKDEELVAAVTEYATRIHASVEAGSVFACQFHPEKSGEVGLQILRNFAKIKQK